MKIDARVEFDEATAAELFRDYVRVPVDMDYVEADYESVHDWVSNELETMFGRSFMREQFTIVNMDEIVEAISFDEFEDKTSEF